MDTPVAIVQAYLHLCGYFTATEYPVIEGGRHGGYQMATDLDVLAVRFPKARALVQSRGKRRGKRMDPDREPLPDPDPGRVDMIIGEVKEGKAQLNRAARNPNVLRTVLARFGCCDDAHAEAASERLLRKGNTDLPTGHHVRLVAFGSYLSRPLSYPCEVVLLSDLIDAIQDYLHQNWQVIQGVQFKDPALAMLTTLAKTSIGNHESPQQSSQDYTHGES